MTEKEIFSGERNDLRRQAIEKHRARTAGTAENLDKLSPEKASQVLYELRIHQVELEMQNEELRQAQEKLEILQARYFDLYELAPVGYVTLSEAGLILKANLKVANLLGAARGALIEQPLTRFIHPEDQDIYYRHRKLLLETGTPQACELRMRGPDDSQCWVRIDAEAAREADGSFLCPTVIIDINFHKKMEEALKKVETSNRRARQSAHVGIWEWDITADRLSWCEEMYALFEKDPQTFIPSNQAVMDCIVPEDRSLAAQAIEATLKDGMPFDVEYRIKDRRRQIKWLQAKGEAHFDPQGQPVLAAGTVHDVTARKQSEERLRESHLRFELANRATFDAIWDLNLQSGTVWRNENFQTLFGYRAEDLDPTLESWIGLVHPEDLDRVKAGITKAIDSGEEFWSDQYRFRRKEGTYAEVEDRGFICREEGDKPLRMIGAMQDISERKRAEEGLRQSEHEKSFLNDLAKIFLTVTDENMYAEVLKIVLREMKSQFGVFAYLDEHGAAVAPSMTRDIWDKCNIPDKTVVFPRETWGDSIWAKAILEKRSLWKNELVKVPQGHVPIENVMIVPLLFRGEVIAHFEVANRQGGYGEAEKEGLEKIAAFIAPVLQARLERKQAAEALEQNRSELAAVYDHAPIMMCVVDETRQVVYANRAFSKFTGLSETELKAGRACGILGCVNALEDPRGCGFGTDCQECPLRLAMEETLHTGRSNRNILQSMILSQAGRSQEVFLLGSTALIPTSSRPNLLLCLVDITERHQAEEDLLKSQSKYRRLYESLMDAYVSVDMSGRITEFNSAYKDLLGYSEEELHRLTYVDLTPERWHALERGIVGDQILAKGYSDIYEKEYRRKDGTEFPVELRTFLIRDSAGRPEGMWAIVRDISERKRVEDALRQAEEKYSLAFQASPDWGVITTLDEGVFVEVNKAFERLSGFGREEVLGRSAEELGFWDEPEERDLLADGLKRKGSVRNMEVRFRLKSGKVHDFLLSAELIELEGASCVLTVARDVTELRSLEAQLRQAQKMEAVGRLAGGVAHDFNNMLGVIMGYTDLALRRLNAQEPLYHDLQEVNNAARRSADLTRQLLAFSRKQIVAPKVLNLNEAVTQQQKMLARLIGEDIELKFIPRPDLWSIRLDPSQVDQVLANLAVNARDAIAGVGSITLEIANVTLDEGYTRRHPYTSPGDYVMLAVSDSGSGMEGEILERIFEPFFTTKGEGQGTGLGLSTVYGIVKQNGGSIQAYSEPGRGTTFKIYFPRVLGEAVPVETVKETPLSGSETVLIVEDEPQILLLAKRTLEHYGYKTVGAGSPGEALMLLEKHRGPLHLLLTDVIMPNLTGPELKGRVEALRPGIKTLFMSGYTAEVIAQRGLLEEGLAFVQKPFTVEDLVGKVRRVLDA